MNERRCDKSRSLRKKRWNTKFSLVGRREKKRWQAMESATMDGDVKTLELDKICRVCLTIKKDMRPLYGEMIAEMLMECARIQVNFD